MAQCLHEHLDDVKVLFDMPSCSVALLSSTDMGSVAGQVLLLMCQRPTMGRL